LALDVSGDGTAETEVTVAADLGTGTFKHVGFVYDASAGECAFYVDGVQVGTTQTGLPTSIFNSSAAFMISGDATPTNFFDGRIQDARPWVNVELTSAEVLAMHNLYLAGGAQDYAFFM
jgi:hypothetical protein